MNLKKNKSQSQLLDSFISHPHFAMHPILVIAKKTLIFNVFNIKRVLICIILMVIVPVIMLLITPANSYITYEYYITEEFDIEYNIIIATLTETVGIIVFFYSFGLIFTLFISVSAAPLISEELKSGTMIILVSKPINRHGIVIGKLIAIFLFGIFVSIISLLIITVVGMIKFPFPDPLQFFLLHFIYSIFIIISFGGLSLGISCVFKKPRNAILIPIILIIFSYLIGIIIKAILVMTTSLGTPSIYDQMQLYHFDLSYHLANLYIALAELYVPGASNNFVWNNFLLYFGITKYNTNLYCDSSGDCSVLHNYIITTNYYLPIISSLILILIGLLLLFGGILFLKKRDIS
ncbi:MAG: ABC transporter permease [Promethearchaeota archaeon]